LSPEELASLPADLYGHADFSKTIPFSETRYHKTGLEHIY